MIQYYPWITFEDQLTLESCGVYLVETIEVWNAHNFYEHLGHPDMRRFITFYGFEG